MELLLFAFWFFLPVGLANTAPVFAAKIPGLESFTYPMDFHKKFRGKRIFGDHKTFRGLFSGIIMATAVVLLQQVLFVSVPYIREISEINYPLINIWIFGPLCAVGALFGDAIKSFFKRQIGVPPGKTWFPFDQLDYIFGGIIATYFYIPLKIEFYLIAIFLFFGLHLLFTYMGYVLGLKESPI